MTIMVRNAQKDQGDAAGIVFARAFHDDPLFAGLCRNVSRRSRCLRHIFAAEFTDVFRYGEVSVATDDGKVVGVACWYDSPLHRLTLPRTIRQAVRVAPALPGLGTMAPTAVGLLSLSEKRHPKDRDHSYLAVLAVDPAVQGRGIGRRLTEERLRAADEAGIGCYLETQTMANVSYYSRIGFEVTSSVPGWTDGPEIYFMWRDPRPPDQD